MQLIKKKYKNAEKRTLGIIRNKMGVFLKIKIEKW
jgi:hypothetical protein